MKTLRNIGQEQIFYTNQKYINVLKNVKFG